MYLPSLTLSGKEEKDMKARMLRLKRTGKRLGNGWAATQAARRKGRRRKHTKSKGYSF